MLNLCFMSCMLGWSDVPPQDVIRAAQYAGLNHIDWVTCHGVPAKELKKLSSGNGLETVAYTDFGTLFQKGCLPGWDGEIRRILDNAAELGAPVVMIPPFPIQGIQSREEAGKRWTEFFAKAVEEARKHPLFLTVESTGFHNPLAGAKEMLALLRDVPGLKITFDMGNAATDDDPLEVYRMQKEHIVHFHQKDWHISREAVPGSYAGMTGLYYANAWVGHGDLAIQRFWEQVDPEQKKNCFVDIETIDFTGSVSREESIRQTAERMRHW